MLFRSKLKNGKITKDFEFRPQIPKFEYKKQSQYIKEPIVARLINSKSKRQERLNKIKKEKDIKELTFDSASGQKLFKPLISRGPKKRNNYESKTIYDKLYKEKYIPEKRHIAKEKDKERWSRIQEKSYSVTYSEKVLKGARRKKCEELFTLLDPDSCGSINSTHIRLEYLSSKALEALEPSLIEIENKKLSLNKEGFYMLIDPLLQKLSLNQLRELIAGPKKILDSELKKSTFVVCLKLLLANNIKEFRKICSKEKASFKDTKRFIREIV